MKSNTDVYWNIHKKCWSVKSRLTGKIMAHAHAVEIDDVNFIVQPAGRKRVLKEKRKNVHAFVRGNFKSLYITPHPPMKVIGYDTQVFYDPYKNSTFVEEGGRAIYSAKKVYMASDKKVYAWVK